MSVPKGIGFESRDGRHEQFELRSNSDGTWTVQTKCLLYNKEINVKLRDIDIATLRAWLCANWP